MGRHSNTGCGLLRQFGIPRQSWILHIKSGQKKALLKTGLFSNRRLNSAVNREACTDIQHLGFNICNHLLRGSILKAIEDIAHPVSQLNCLIDAKPRVVIAGVPTRNPEVTKGERGSLGTAFLLTVINASPMARSASVPVYSLPIRLTSIR